MDVSQRLGAEQLTDDWDDLINLADKCQGVLHPQFNKSYYHDTFQNEQHMDCDA